MRIRSLQMERQWRQDTFERLRFDIQEAVAARADWWEDYQRAYRTYRLIPPGEKTFPWPNCSNIIPPLTTMSIEQNRRRLVMYYVQDGEYIHLSGLRAGVEATGSAEATQALLRWQADNELDYLSFVDGFVGEFLIGGTAFGLLEWCYEERLVADALVLGRDRLVPTNEGPAWIPVGETMGRRSTNQQLFDELFGGLGVKQTGEPQLLKGTKKQPVQQWRVRYQDERGRKRTADVEIDRSEHLGKEVQVTAQMLRVVKNQPISRVLTADRVIMPPGDHGIQDAEFIAVKGWVSWETVQKNWDEGFWISDADEKEKLSNQYGGDPMGPLDREGPGDWEEEREAQEDQDRYVGVDSERFRSRKIPMMRVMRRWPIAKDKKHLPESSITILPRHGMVVRTQFAGVDNRMERRNVVKHNFIRARNEAYGIGLCRVMESVQEETNVTVNSQIDANNITTLPMIFVDHTASFLRDNMQYFPGQVVKVSSPGENVLIPQWPSRIAEYENQLQRLAAWAQDLSHQGPSSGGRDPGTPWQNRTARGAQILLSEGNFNVFYDARLLGLSVTEYFKIVHALDAGNMPPKKQIAILGSDTVAQPFTVRREDVRGEYMYHFEAGQAVLNDEMRRQLFTEAFQLIAPIAQAPSEQVPRPLWEFAKEILRQRGFKNPDKFLPPPMDHWGSPKSPHVEHEVFKLGIPVRVHPLDVDQIHVQAHLEWAATEDFETMPREMVEAFNQHLLLHQRRIQAAGSGGQGSVGPTGVVMGGRLALQGNPGMNSSPGMPPTIQPSQTPPPMGPVSLFGG